MDWVLIFSVLWVFNGQPVNSETWTNVNYTSRELCDQAVTDLKAEMAKPMEGVETFVRALCVQRKGAAGE